MSRMMHSLSQRESLEEKKKIPIALILSLCFWDRMGGKSALSSLTRYSLCFCTQKRRSATVRNFTFRLPERIQPLAHVCQSTASSPSCHGVLCMECLARLQEGIYPLCLLFPFSSHSVLIRTYRVEEGSWELLDLQISAQETGKGKVHWSLSFYGSCYLLWGFYSQIWRD